MKYQFLPFALIVIQSSCKPNLDLKLPSDWSKANLKGKVQSIEEKEYFLKYDDSGDTNFILMNRRIIKYSQDGNLESEISHDKVSVFDKEMIDGELQYVYSDKPRLLEKIMKSEYSTSPKTYCQREYEYDDDGYTEKYYSDEGELLSWTKHFLNKNNYNDSVVNYEPNNTPFEYYHYAYNDGGIIKEFKFYNKNASLETTEERFLDEHGNDTLTVSKSADNQKKYFKTSYAYDSMGNYIQKKSINNSRIEVIVNREIRYY